MRPVNLAAADLGQLLQLLPVQRAGAALLLAAIGLPIVGVVIVGLDIMPVRFAMMHVALLGIAVGLLTGLDPMLCALVACALAGGAVAPLARTPDGLSGAMGLLMSSGHRGRAPGPRGLRGQRLRRVRPAVGLDPVGGHP